MRLIKLSFENLNSLTGKWEIDFTAPEFDGIFAITGATGAGKTTILDAICLALFGKTPRLGEITQGKNELMSRQKNDCRSQLRFEVKGKQYQATWEQKRSKSKDGSSKLREVNHELLDVLEQKKITEKKTETSKEIPKILGGMGFEQFTRTMMLAQGDFAKFLQASSDDRAELLEQITGTKIYSDISIKVHVLNKEQQDKLKELENNVPKFDEQKEQVWRTQLGQCRVEEEKIKQEIKNQEELCNQKNNLKEHQINHQGLLKEQEQLEQQKQDFEPQVKKLARAIEAQKIEGVYQLWQKDLVFQKCNREEIHELNQKLPQQQQEELETKNDWEKEQQDFLEIEQGLKDLQEIVLPKVRKLDTDLAVWMAKRDSAQKELGQLEETKRINQQKKAEAQQQQTEYQEQKGKCENYLCEHQVDEKLGEVLPKLLLRWKDFQENQKDILKFEAEFQRASSEYDKKDREHEQKKNQVDDLKEKYNENHEKSQALQQQLRQLPDSSEVQRQIFDCEKVLSYQCNKAEILAKYGEIKQKQKQNQKQRADLTAQLSDLDKTVAQQQKQYDTLKAQHEQMRKVMSLTDWRQELQDGCPCPLCGSLQHPFAIEIQELNNQLADELGACGQKLKALTKEKSECDSDLKLAENDAKHLQKQLQDQEQELQKLNKDNNELVESDDSIDVLLSQLKKHEDDLQKIEGLQKELKKSQESEQKLDWQIRDEERALQTIKTALQEMKSKKEIAQSRLQEEKQKQAEYKQEFKQDLVDCLPQDFDLNEEMMKGLHQRKGDYESANNELNRLELVLSSLDKDLKNIEKDEKDNSKAIEKTLQILQDLDQQEQALKRQRTALFEDKGFEVEDNADAVEKKYQNKVAQQQAVLDKAKENHLGKQKILENSQNSLEELEKQKGALNQAVVESWQKFENACREKEFIDEADFLSACLSEEEIEQLSKKRDDLHKKEHVLESQLKDMQLKINELQEKCQHADDLEEQKKILDEWKTQLAEKNQEIGKLDGDLAQLKKEKEEYQKQSEAIKEQKKICELWQELDRLIGSSSGKAYRNFAQGLTFDGLIQKANRQLDKISDRRYLLKRGQDLEIQVVDSYQDGVDRSSKNLSGGESFLVSLALALALAEMNSQEISIDSLFLDEGFGTLDEETLETVLSALGELRNKGKLIGVISHIRTLTDRIPTQIQVIKQSKGNSILRGAGVSNKREN